MSISDVSDIFSGSSGMSFLDSTSFKRKYDLSPVASQTPENTSESTIKKDTNKQENTEPVSAPLVQVQEIEDVDQEINESEQFQEVPQEKLSNHSSSLYSSIESSIPLPPRDSSDPKLSQDQQMSSWRKSLSDYPVVTADIRNNLLQCRDDLFHIVTDLCDENKRLNDMYNEIRRSPLAEEIKQEYEDAIAEWSEKFQDLQNLYNQVLDSNRDLQNELDNEKRENDRLRDQLSYIPQLEQDLKSAVIRRDVLEKELRDTQNELDFVQEEKRKVEALADSQKKELRSLKVELNTLKAELNEGVSKSSSRNASSSRATDEQDSMVLYNSRPSLPKREKTNQPIATALYDYEGNCEFNSAPMRKGDKMTVLKYKDTGDWVLVQLDSLQTWEPVSYLSIQDSNKSSGYTRPRSTHLSGKSVSNNRKKAVVIADFEGIDHSEMSVKKGEIVQISKENEEWLYGSVGARKGWIPSTFVNFI